MRAVHIDSLRQAFPVVEIVRDADSVTVLRVDRPQPRGGSVLSVLVTLEADFPRSAPTVRTLGGREISIGVADGTAASWDPATSLLGIAVGNALNNLQSLLGEMPPPSIDAILPSLANLTDDVLGDLASNPLCMECFAYQIPFAKKVREETKTIVATLERTAMSNIRSKAAVEQLRLDVKSLQQRLQDSMRAIQEVKETPQFMETCTTSGVTRLVDGFIKQTAADANRDADHVLACSLPAEREAFEAALNAFIDRRRQVHEADLKKRSLLQSRAAS
jgi:hypothetical protein